MPPVDMCIFDLGEAWRILADIAVLWGFPASWGFPNRWMVYNGNPMKMDNLRVPPFMEPPIIGKTKVVGNGLGMSNVCKNLHNR